MTKILDIGPVLLRTLPTLAPGRATLDLVALLNDCMAHQPSPPDAVSLAQWATAIDTARRQQQATGAGGASQARALEQLETTLLEHFPAWQPGWAWGELALAHALQVGAPARVEALLSLPGAPIGAALSALVLPRCTDPALRASGARQAVSFSPATTHTALGWALLADTTANVRAAMVVRLLARGADPNASTGTPGTAPLLLTRQPEILEYLLNAGARLPVDAGASWLDPALPEGVVGQQLASWSKALADGHATLGKDLHAALPRLVEAMAAYLAARPPSSFASTLDLVRQFRAVARRVEVDVIRPHPEDPDLPAAWVRAHLVRLAAGADARNTSAPDQVLPPAMWPAPRHAGQVPGSAAPAPLWGYLLYLMNRSNGPPTTPPPPDPDWWPAVPATLEEMETAAGPMGQMLAWRLLGLLHDPMAATQGLPCWRQAVATALRRGVDIQAAITQQDIATPHRPNLPPRACAPWLSRRDSEANATWERLLDLAAADFLDHPDAWPTDAAQLVLGGLVLGGLARPRQAQQAHALLARHRVAVDTRQLAGWLTGAWACHQGGQKRAPERQALGLALSLPVASATAPRARL